MSTRMLDELLRNFVEQPKEKTGLNDEQHADAKVLVVQLQLKILQAERLVQNLVVVCARQAARRDGEGTGGQQDGMGSQFGGM